MRLSIRSLLILAVAVNIFSLAAHAPARSEPKPKTKPPLIFANSKTQLPIHPLAAYGIPISAIINGQAVRGTCLSSVNSRGPAHYAGLRSGDVLLNMNNKAAESPDMTIQLIKEFSGRPVLIKFGRISGDTIAVQETNYTFVDKTAGAFDMSSPGSDSMESYGTVRVKAKDKEATVEELEDFMLQIVNNDRSSNGGLPRLRRSSVLASMARAYAEDIVKRDFFGHKDLDGRGMAERAIAAGINAYTAENLAYAKTSGDSRDMLRRCQLNMMSEPKDVSDNHRGTILDARHKCVGIGVAFKANAGVIAVQKFSHDDLP